MSDAQFSYQDLTPDTILNAIESLGIFPESGLLALNSYENRVYQFRGEGSSRYVVKFYRPNRWSKAQIQEEHDLAFELVESEVPMVAPLKFDGESLLEYQGYLFALFPSVGGRQFEVDNLEQLEWVGRFMGRAHQVCTGKSFQHRPDINIQEYMLDARDFIRQGTFIPRYIETSFFTVLDLIIDETRERFTDNYSSIRLHGDCHAGNILWQDGPVFVDLDDCRMGPAVQDLWMMLSGDRNDQLVQLDVLLGGYEEFSSFKSSELALIEPLRAMRMVNYMAWLARRWTDPAFPHNFPWFNTDKYWEQQILHLKEQVSVLREPPLSLTPQF